MVKCADCGLLCVRRLDSRALEEVDSEVRRTWKLPSQPNTSYKMHDDLPLCFDRVEEFQLELALVKDSGTTCDGIIGILSKERDCPSFDAWKQGFSPKEHVELKILNDQRLWQATREDADRLWRDRQEERRELYEMSRDETARKWRDEDARRQRLHFFFGVVAGGIVTLAAAVISGLTSRGAVL